MPASDKALTEKQSRFVQKYFELGSPSDAYRAAYDAENMTPGAIAGEAQKLMRKPHIARIIAKTREASVKRTEVTLEEVMAMVREGAEMSRSQNKGNEVVQAAMSLAKLAGLVVEKSEVKDLRASTAHLRAVADLAEKAAKDADEPRIPPAEQLASNAASAKSLKDIN